MEAKQVYIIILNWNGAHDTIECLDSLLKIQHDNYQLILVDNKSEDDNFKELNDWCIKNIANVFYYSQTTALLGGDPEVEHQLDLMDSKSKLLIIRNDDNLGFAAGNNVALNYVLTKKEDSYSLVLNNDTVVEPDFLIKLSDFMDSNQEYVACTPQMRLFEPKTLIWNCGGKITWFGNRKYFYAGEHYERVPQSGTQDIGFITGCALFFQPQRTGIFTEKFFFGEEDFEFSLRLKREKKKIACVFDSVLYHKVGGSIAKHDNPKVLNRTFMFYSSRLINQKDFYAQPLLLIIQIMAVVYGFVMIILRYRINVYKSLRFFMDVLKFVRNNSSVTKEDFNIIMEKKF